MNRSIGDLLRPAVTGLAKLIPRIGRSLSIGLDLGPHALNMVQFDGGAGKVCIRAVASLPYACPRDDLYGHPQELRALLKQAQARQPFKGRHVVSCLPAAEIKILTVAFKQAQGQSDALAVVAELRERVQGNLNDMIIDFMTLRQDDRASGDGEALVALAPRKNVLAYLELLTSAGLAVDALDVGPAALARLARHVGARHWTEFPQMPNVLLVNFGAEASFLTVIWGRRLMLDRAVEFGENRLLFRLKQVLDMPEALAMPLLYSRQAGSPLPDVGQDETTSTIAEVLRPEIAALLGEINKTLIYMASKTRGRSIDAVYLAGRVARYPGILKALGEQLQVPVEILNPISAFASTDCPSKSDHDLGMMPGIALATGLALRGIPEYV